MSNNISGLLVKHDIMTSLCLLLRLRLHVTHISDLFAYVWWVMCLCVYVCVTFHIVIHKHKFLQVNYQPGLPHFSQHIDPHKPFLPFLHESGDSVDLHVAGHHVGFVLDLWKFGSREHHWWLEEAKGWEPQPQIPGKRDAIGQRCDKKSGNDEGETEKKRVNTNNFDPDVQ